MKDDFQLILTCSVCFCMIQGNTTIYRLVRGLSGDCIGSLSFPGLWGSLFICTVIKCFLFIPFTLKIVIQYSSPTLAVTHLRSIMSCVHPHSSHLSRLYSSLRSIPLVYLLSTLYFPSPPIMYNCYILSCNM